MNGRRSAIYIYPETPCSRNLFLAWKGQNRLPLRVIISKSEALFPFFFTSTSWTQKPLAAPI